MRVEDVKRVEWTPELLGKRLEAFMVEETVVVRCVGLDGSSLSRGVS
jgi:hypothetical protein